MVVGGRAGLALASAVLVLLTAAALGRSVANGFVDFDDGVYLTENATVRQGLTPEGVRWAFTTFHGANWHPLTWLSHMLDVELFGLAAPWHHLTGLLLHAASVLLFFLFLRAGTGSTLRSFVAAALFAVHPLRVESVAWASERKDVLSVLFWMLALVSWVRQTRSRGVAWYLAALLATAAGLLTKGMGVTFPFVLLLLDVWPLGRWLHPAAGDRRWRTLAPVVEKVPFFALSAASSVMTYLAQSRGGAVTLMERQHFAAKAVNALTSYVAYLGKMVWPEGLAIFYPLGHGSVPWTEGLTLGLVLAGLTLGAVLSWRRAPYLGVGWFWYLGVLVPVIGLVQVGSQSMADRYTYLPQAGLMVALVWGLGDLGRRHPAVTRALTLLAPAVLALLVSLSFRQSSHWRDNYTLFRHTVEVTDRNWLAYNNFGLILERQGRYDEAIGYLSRALEFNPEANIYNNLGNLMDMKGDFARAMEYYQVALRLKPGTATFHYNLANTLQRLNRLDEAIAHYREALRFKPDHSDSHNNLAIVFINRGFPDLALRHYQEAVRLDPSNTEALNNLGVLLNQMGRREEAIARFMQALAVRPGYSMAMTNLAETYLALGLKDEAAGWLRRALAADPRNTRAAAILEVVRPR
jgi:tetratricopeptide (TPR) repeat protein